MLELQHKKIKFMLMAKKNFISEVLYVVFTVQNYHSIPIPLISGLITNPESITMLSFHILPNNLL
jgi:uncharacterized integral membrane protein